MKQLVSVNLTSKSADWTPPEMFYGETLTLALRFFRTTEGVDVETALTVDSFVASIGSVDEPPRGGKFGLKIGPAAASPTNTTDLVDAAGTATALRTAINDTAAAAAYGVARVVAVDGSWLIFFGDGTEQVPLEVVNNGLWPISFGRVSAWQVDGKWVHELRLIQTPVAMTSSHDVALPPQPTVTRIRAGGAEGTFEWNEIQELYVPPDFRGAYILKKGFGKTTLLSREDDIEAIQTALQALGADCFKVTLPLSQRPTIEFVGDYRGSSHDLLVAEVKQSPPGDLTFSVVLDRAELGAALRVQEAVTLPLEIRVVGTDDAGFEGELVALHLPVILRRPVIWPFLAERPAIDWLRPFSPKTYVPFGANQTLTGNKFYTAVVGDGEGNEFVIATGLGGEMIHVFGRENFSGGRQLVHGVDFAVTIDSDNQITVMALGDPPAADGWVITAVSAQTIAEWANDLTVTVPQVVAGGGYPSLPDYMDDTSERLETLESLILPGTPPAVANSKLVGMVTVIPEISEILQWRGTAEEMAALFTKEGVDAAKLPSRKPTSMLPAVHNATPTDPLPDPLPAVDAGEVWVAAARTLIPGGGGIRSSYVENDGFVASDGRILYPAIRAGTTNSYYPAAFERTLFAMTINDQMMALNRTVEILWGVQVQLVHASCKAQWVLSLELGSFAAETEPATLDLNLEAVEWAAPVFSQAIVLSPLAQSHFFGLRILRAVSELKLDQQRYGNWTPNNAAAPASANFAIRARLTHFDTENRNDPRGYVAWRLIGSIEVAEDGSQTTKPAQARIY